MSEADKLIELYIIAWVIGLFFLLMFFGTLIDFFFDKLKKKRDNKNKKYIKR